MLHSRDKRVGEAIKQAISRIFQQEISDPRLPQIVTIRHVEVTKDLRHAKVYYSQIPDDEEAMDKMEDLIEESYGFIRSLVADEVNIKFTPDLDFIFDPSEQDYQKINTVLQDIHRKKKK